MTSPLVAERDWLTVRETAEMLEMNQRTLYSRIGRNQIESILISGGRRLIHRDEVERIRQEGN